MGPPGVNYFLPPLLDIFFPPIPPGPPGFPTSPLPDEYMSPLKLIFLLGGVGVALMKPFFAIAPSYFLPPWCLPWCFFLASSFFISFLDSFS